MPCSNPLACCPSVVPQEESPFFQELKASQPFFLMAGPNVIQSEEHVLKMCRQIKAVTGACTASVGSGSATLNFHSSMDTRGASDASLPAAALLDLQ